jgi:hypothetical protein
MAKTRRNKNKTCRRLRTAHRARRGGGYVTSQQYFDPDVYPPSSILPAPSTNATPEDIRPILYATIPPSKLMEGGRSRRKSRRSRGGFSPSIMGSFLANAERAIVPLALYMAYKVVAKPGQTLASSNNSSRRSRKGQKSRRSRR